MLEKEKVYIPKTSPSALSPSPIIIPSILIAAATAASSSSSPTPTSIPIPSTPVPRVHLSIVTIPRVHLLAITSASTSIVVPPRVRLLLVVGPIVPVVHLALVVLLLHWLVHLLHDELLHVGHHLSHQGRVHHVRAQVHLAEQLVAHTARGVLELLLVLILVMLLLLAALVVVEVDFRGGRRVGSVFALFMQRQWPLEEFGSLEDLDRVLNGGSVAVRDERVRALSLFVVPRDLHQLHRTGLMRE